jgi:uncharacterized phiE125 gp8 family phage protein
MSERPILIEAPDEDVLTLAECKDMLGISGTSQDDLIEAAMAASVSALDAASGGWLGRALRPQTWELRLDEFPSCDDEIQLPFPPLISVTSIIYDDAAGDETTMDAADYNVLGVGGRSYGSVKPIYGSNWPSSLCYPESVRIQYICGYDDDDMPAAIQQAVAMMTRSVMANVERNLFVTHDKVEGVGEKRYSVSTDGIKVMKQASDALLQSYKIWTV